jgi:hypothetical protein
MIHLFTDLLIGFQDFLKIREKFILEKYIKIKKIKKESKKEQ